MIPIHQFDNGEAWFEMEADDFGPDTDRKFDCLITSEYEADQRKRPSITEPARYYALFSGDQSQIHAIVRTGLYDAPGAHGGRLVHGHGRIPPYGRHAGKIEDLAKFLRNLHGLDPDFHLGPECCPFHDDHMPRPT